MLQSHTKDKRTAPQEEENNNIKYMLLWLPKLRDLRTSIFYLNYFILLLAFCFVWFDSLRPINNLSVIKGRVFQVEPVLS